MPILKPQIQAALREAGLNHPEDSQDLTQSLNKNKLSLDDTLEVVSGIMQFGGTEQSRLRAAELTLKMHGTLKESGQSQPQITIVINDSKSPGGINPILLPRELSSTHSS